MEQTQESNERLQEQLDTYKQKYDQCTEQISHLESTFSKLQEQLAESRTKVCKHIDISITVTIFPFDF